LLPIMSAPKGDLSSRTVESSEWLSSLGPGLITGAADDDPSGIATYSQTGAKFGFDLLWTIVLTLPLMVGIQIISARVGAITRKGLAANLVAVYPKPIVALAVTLLLCANIFNIAADLNAMAACARMIVGGPIVLYVVIFGIASLLIQLFAPYKQTVRFLKWLTLALFAYVAAMFTIHVPWGEVGATIVHPPLHATREYFGMIVAIFGTTISPYMFFWQAAHEVEKAKDDGEPLRVTKYSKAREHFKRINLDTWVGMAMSNLIAFCIIVTAAVVMHQHGQTDVQTTEQAAQALKPVAGNLAFGLFALGIIGTGLLALPVLSGSAAFALSDTFGWRSGLDHMPQEARAFYTVIGLAMIAGIVLCLMKLDPIKALFLSAVINGVVAVPILGLLMDTARRPQIMGKFPIRGLLHFVGWTGTAIMAIVVIAMIFTL
jgi:NRAMP (natural resistance-associated macrophage protein)-like metal ion transporter